MSRGGCLPNGWGMGKGKGKVRIDGKEETRI